MFLSFWVNKKRKNQIFRTKVFICDECPEQFLTTKGLNQHKSQSHHQIGGVSDKKFICDRCDTGKDILIYGRNTMYSMTQETDFQKNADLNQLCQ